MEEPYRILILDDRPEDAELAERQLERGGIPCTVKRVDREEEYRWALEEWSPSLVLCDYTVPGFDGFEALTLAREMAPDVPVVMFTGTVSEHTAIQCLKAGAHDYILKDNLARLGPAVDAALKASRDRKLKREAEEALKDSERRYRTLVETAPDAIVATDAEGRITLWNGAAEDVFGWPEEEALDRPISGFIPLQGKGPGEPAGDGGFQAFLEGSEGTAQTSLDLHRMDGSAFPAEVSLSISREGLGSGVTAVIRDVSERKLAQSALESLSRRHELLLTSAGEGIIGLDPDGTVNYVNPAALSLLGREARDLLGKELHPRIHGSPSGEEDAGDAYPILQALQDGSSFRGDLTFTRGDGRAFFAAASLTPILDGETVTGGVMIFEDITHRMEQAEALKASEERYRGFFDNAVYGIYLSTAEGNFKDVNPALVAMLGYESSEELMNLDMGQELYVDPKERDALVRSFLRSGRVVGAEATWLRKDGSTLPVRLSGRAVFEGPEDFRFFEVMVEDLSERKTLEDQLRQAQKMEAVGQLTGGIAHDFNNVLSVILLNSELLLASLEAGESADETEVRTIYDSAKRASAITRKLLGFSRRAELLIEPVRLDKVVKGIAPMLRALLPESVSLDLELPDEVGPVSVDTGSMEQILLNLVGNSRDAISEGGQVKVTVVEEELDAGYVADHPHVIPGRYICMEVEDDGTGMDDETLEKIFDPFYSTKTPDAGTGLGMAMVYGLTKQQGGYVHVYSELGVGTTTRVYFPLHESEPEAEELTAEEESQDFAPATILLVEDDESLQRVAERALSERGYEVLTAMEGSQALDLFRAHRERIDLIISDMVLPGLGGLELLARIREEFGPVPFILTSGYSPRSLDGERELLSTVPFIRKPWVLKDLLVTMRDALESEPSKLEASFGEHTDH